MSLNTSEFWATHIADANLETIVIQRPTKAERDGFDGRLKILVGFYQIVGYVTANATLAIDVRIHAVTNQRRLRRCRRILDGMGVAYRREYRTVCLGDISRSNLQIVIDALAKV